ncbi:hypothetical protein IV203_021509 [Nitzschia inconspicua]|uniref:No apical meristem-associated C-terminal domain-containing protein n=1 Tax=Nitzschia inconspicua TaxID=303405 RepID=A0A9K3KH08_9STRA|nr:hypothetical protein IV203_022707 [Nitzschia inconspicua]KAG7343564.1 hypothetical protein IV203_021509 [Nitzschia inconspicua]
MPPSKKSRTDITSGDNTQKKEESKSFTKVEDILLCECHVNVSSDPTIGTGQTAEERWRRIQVLFSRNKCNSSHVKDIERDADSLRNRFKKQIQPAVVKFMPHWRAATNEKRCGTSHQDVLNNALARYKESNNECPFKFEHVLDTLRLLPKYNPNLNNVNAIVWDDDDEEGPDNKQINMTTSSVGGGGNNRRIGSKNRAKEMEREEASYAKKKAALMEQLAASNKAIAESFATIAITKQIECFRSNFRMFKDMGMHEEAEAELKWIKKLKMKLRAPATSVAISATSPAASDLTQSSATASNEFD